MNGRPPESSYDPAQIRDNVTSAADRRQFWFKPWIDSSGLSPEQLVAHVRSQLDSEGTWTDYCELRMEVDRPLRSTSSRLTARRGSGPREALV